MDSGMTRREYEWFGRNQVKANCVMGNDYYITNEHLVHDDGKTSRAGEIFGYYVITRQYFERYQLPVMHTETNIHNVKHAPAWLKKQWANILRLRQDGVTILGFTWYSLTDQVDWDSALREDKGRVNPCGLVDLRRKVRPVGKAYAQLIKDWRSHTIFGGRVAL
jgi:beta-glucosidase/6-phospho-beta-glucosidase/beta-galactosidase